MTPAINHCLNINAPADLDLMSANESAQLALLYNVIYKFITLPKDFPKFYMELSNFAPESAFTASNFSVHRNCKFPFAAFGQ